MRYLKRNPCFLMNSNLGQITENGVEGATTVEGK